MTVRMRIALKIAYDGAAFYGHQRQPDARTVEGECLKALRDARILSDPSEAFFRSASRTDRGVSAIGNVIAFNTTTRPEAVVGAFDNRARDVWGWAYAIVPENFHPRGARERWYRYHIFDPLPLARLREMGSAFEGAHDFRSFTSDPVAGPLRINRIEVRRDAGVTCLDFYAPSFRRRMVRRLVAAIAAYARGDVSLREIRDAFDGAKRDFGTVPPEPLFLMDVRYGFPFTIVRKPKAESDWREISRNATLRERFVLALDDALRESRVPW